MKICDCDDWENSASQIFNAQRLAENHRIKYTGSYWRYCPWCSRQLWEEG